MPRGKEQILKKKIFGHVKNGKEDFMQDYCNRGEKLGSTPNTAKSGGAYSQQNEGVSGWKTH